MTVPMDREDMQRRLQELLDRALAEEGPPAGIDPEILASMTPDETSADRRCDAYAMWAAVTALTQEVKLQGRTFLDLKNTLDAQNSRMLEEIRASYAERERNLQREAERKCRREILSALIDLRDRLSRGRDSARGQVAQAVKADGEAGWWSRWVSRPSPKPMDALDALVRGYELGLERLDQTLDEFHAREIRCEGEMFDPRRMNAIDSEATSAVPEGRVLEVYRSGYEWNGEVFRPAQVKVSRAPGAENGK